MKLKKNYLTSEEIIEICDTLSEMENPIEREIVKIGMIAQFTCDLSDIEYDSCNDIYDKLYENNISLDISVFNYDVIEEFLKERFGMVRVVKDFLEDISNKIDEIGQIDQEQLVEKLKELTDNG